MKFLFALTTSHLSDLRQQTQINHVSLTGSSAPPSLSPSQTSCQSKPEIKTEPKELPEEEESPNQEEVKEEKEDLSLLAIESSSSLASPSTSQSKTDVEQSEFPAKAIAQSMQERFSFLPDPVAEGQWSAIEEAARNAGFVLGR